MTTLITSESVTEGHPDKVADRISDAILDALLTADRKARAACETLVTTGLVLIGGEITTKTYVDIGQIARRVIADVGYTNSQYGFHHLDCAILSAIQEQSADIAAAVDRSKEERNGETRNDYTQLGAGDQGIMYGYASVETKELMPLPIVLAHRLTKRLAAVRKDGTLSYLRPDGKSQVTVLYEEDRPIKVKTVLVAAQHDPDVESERIEQDVLQEVIHPTLQEWIDDSTEILINSSGRFVIGGPVADTGMTGRKIIVDTYGGYGSHGGGAFSGKDPTKVDRSGSYFSRYVAKNIVAAGLARAVEVQIAYAIGKATPLAINIHTYGTGKIGDDALRRIIIDLFDFRPAAILERLDLLQPIYTPFSVYGHFGRIELDPTWEQTDMVEDLHRAAGK
ncbi:methionine adenosyltransferase [Candidatus Bipolaricaulota bacterium]|nr:methionine adenosyltransferase [Candidatus Bipolaricaulota bacterium]